MSLNSDSPHELRISLGGSARRAGLNLGGAWKRFARADSRPVPPWLRLGRLGGVELAALGLSAVLAAMVFLDAPLVHWARGLDPMLVLSFEAVTALGKSDWSLVPLGILAVALAGANGPGLRPRLRGALAAWTELLAYIVLVVAGSGLAVATLKWLIGRARPLHFDALGAFGFSPAAGHASFASFPSGHATTIFALAAALALLAPKLRHAAFALAFWVALSRVAIGAHYASDATAGALLALGFALWARSLFARKGLLFRVDAQGRYGLRAPRLLAEGRGLAVAALRGSIRHR